MPVNKVIAFGILNDIGLHQAIHEITPLSENEIKQLEYLI
jgi:hypothetical protein